MSLNFPQSRHPLYAPPSLSLKLLPLVEAR